MILSQIVNQIGPGQKRESALALLEQARIMVGSPARAENQEQMSALLEIGRAFSRYDSKRAFEVVDPILDQFNEMTAAAQVLNGFGQQYYQDGELNMQNGNSLAGTAAQLIATLGTLSMSNFERAKAAADRVERPEVRIGAYLAIAQQAISPSEGKMPEVATAKVFTSLLREFAATKVCYSTVTDFARLRGWSTSQPRRTAI